MGYISIKTNRINGCIEYQHNGSISYESNQGENGAWLDAGDLEALSTISFKDGVLYPREIRTVGYADVGGTTHIFMYGEDDRHGVEIADIDDKYFLDSFNSGMTQREIKDELANMVYEEFAYSNIPIGLGDVDKEEFKDSIEHPIKVVDNCLNDGKFWRYERYNFVMTEYLNSVFYGAELKDKNGCSYVVEYEGKELTIEFNPEWEEYVYTVNGKGPFAHSSYEYIGQDCRTVLAYEERERTNNVHSLASRLNVFYKDFDFYDYTDKVDGTEQDVIDDLVVQLNDFTAVNGILNTLKEIKEESELSSEQAQVLDKLIEDVEEVFSSFGKSVDEVLADASVRSEKEAGDSSKDKEARELDM